MPRNAATRDRAATQWAWDQWVGLGQCWPSASLISAEDMYHRKVFPGRIFTIVHCLGAYCETNPFGNSFTGRDRRIAMSPIPPVPSEWMLRSCSLPMGSLLLWDGSIAAHGVGVV